MKKLFPLFACCVIVCSCKNKTAAPETEQPESAVAVSQPISKPSEINGLWTGTFTLSVAEETLHKKAEAFQDEYQKKNNESDMDGYVLNINEIPAALRTVFYREPLNGFYALKQPNKVSVIITGRNDSGQVIGKNICAGNERPLKGSYNKTKNGFTAILQEPGDDKNDGSFILNFLSGDSIATGTWTSLKGDKKVCTLQKKDFVYSPENGTIEGFRQSNDQSRIDFKKNPSTDILSTKDVENLTKPELTILRNLIYARHGYTFANASIRNYFENNDWYLPLKKDIRTDLTELEKKNADKLKSFEQYASSAYDEFGR